MMAAVPATTAFGGDSNAETGEHVAFGSPLVDIKYETTREGESSHSAAQASFGTMSDCPELAFLKIETIEDNDLEATAGDFNDAFGLGMNDGEEASSMPASSGHVQHQHPVDFEVPTPPEVNDEVDDADLEMDEDNASLCTSASQDERELQDAGIPVWDLKRRVRAKINNMDEALVS